MVSGWFLLPAIFKVSKKFLMEFVFLMALVLMSFRVAFVTASLAEEIGKGYWTWFILGVFLPLIAIAILFCLPRKSRKRVTELRAVENDEIFDHLFIAKHSKQRA
jgi:hypothetical protein